jgi:serine/threonine-protein kinase HipA
MIDYQKVTRAIVYLRKIPVGILEKKSLESYSFQYSQDYLRSDQKMAIACAFPLKDGAFISRQLHPFFDNLILEGWLLAYAEKLYHIDKNNRFALLMAVGRSPIGAVSVHPLNPSDKEYLKSEQFEPEHTYPTKIEQIEFPNQGGYCPSCLKPSPKNKILHLRCASQLFGSSRKLKIEMDAEYPLETFSRTVYGGSISGAQRKGLFSLQDATLIADPINSQYILKPDGDFPELPANEHLTMSIARELGFRIPPSALVNIPHLGFVYVIRRFDRINGVPRRMEDMAQIIGELSNDKYESSNEKVAQAIRDHAVAFPLDLNDYFRRLLFCFLIANGDMHLKNWSLLEKETLNGELDLSPCYDLLNTRLPLPRESIDMGLSLLGKKRNLQRTYFYKFALNVLKLDKKPIEKIFSELTQWIQVVEEFTRRSYLSEKSQKKYIELARERFEILSNQRK